MKRVLVTFVLDEETIELLRQIAERKFDGNRSMTMRRLIRDAARDSGVTTEEMECETT